MEVIVLQSEAYNAIVEKIEAIQKSLENGVSKPSDRWIDNAELIALLKISKRTAQQYRDRGLIAFAQVGGKIYYRLSDVEALLMSHYQPISKK